MKKLISLIFILSLFFGLSSCGDDDTAASASTTSAMPSVSADCGGNSCM